MASVTFDHVFKKYGDVTAVNDLNIHIEDKEFLVRDFHVQVVHCENIPELFGDMIISYTGHNILRFMKI